MKGIPVFKEINDGHDFTGSGMRTHNPLFHCFDMAHANNLAQNKLAPYRSDFFVLAVSFGTKQFRFTLNDIVFDNPECFIVCVAPGQISNFEKNGHWFGFCTFFKSEFIKYQSEINFLDDYPFFNIQETNLFPLSEEQFKSLSLNYQQILTEQANQHSYGTEIIRSSFMAALWQIRRIYETTNTKKIVDKTSAVIASKFQFLVNSHFLEKTLVDDYAQVLNITSNHLSQTIKEVTGKTAKSIITQRRLEEAKYLLQYTDNDVAEIAYYLNFLEPTHFTKFFKKESRYTPIQYRRVYKYRH